MNTKTKWFLTVYTCTLLITSTLMAQAQPDSAGAPRYAGELQLRFFPGPEEHLEAGTLQLRLPDPEKHLEAEIANADRSLREALSAHNEANRRFENTTLEQIRQRERFEEFDISPQSTVVILQALENEKLKTELDLHGKRARSGAITKAIAEAKAQGQQVENIGDDPVMKQLRLALDETEIHYQRIREAFEKGGASASEVRIRAIHVQQAMVKIEARQQELVQTALPDNLSALNNQLLQLSIDLTELEARLLYVEQRLQKTRNATGLLDEFERLTKLEIPDAFAQFRQAEQKTRAAQQRVNRAYESYNRFKQEAAENKTDQTDDDPPQESR